MVFRRPIASILSGYKKRGAFDMEKLTYAQRDLFNIRYKKKFPEQYVMEGGLKVADQKYKPSDVQIVPNDLVYVKNGPHKGKFLKVMLYIRENDLYILEGLVRKTPQPKQQWIQGQTSFLMDTPELIPRKDISLAAKDVDDETGETVYLVAEQLKMGEKYFDENYGRWLPKRFVLHNEEYEIPWPHPGDLEPDQYLTLEETVAERTYELHSIAESPLPEGVVDELRNKYSKYKKRYLLEYQARIMNAPSMPLTANQKVYLAKQAERKQQQANKIKPLTEEMKEFIGAKMADHLNAIDNEHLKAHLEDVLNIQIPDFEVTQQKLKGSL